MKFLATMLLECDDASLADLGEAHAKVKAAFAEHGFRATGLRLSTSELSDHAQRDLNKAREAASKVEGT